MLDKNHEWLLNQRIKLTDMLRELVHYENAINRAADKLDECKEAEKNGFESSLSKACSEFKELNQQAKSIRNRYNIMKVYFSC